MRKRIGPLSAVLAVLGLLVAGPTAAFANDGLTVRAHLDGGKPLVVKVDI